MSSQIKQVIVMRNDLGMRKGKMIAQGSHASIAFLTRRLMKEPGWARMIRGNEVRGYKGEAFLTEAEVEWLNSSFAKVCVRVNSEEELLEIHKKAKDAGLEVHLITDSGKTEFHGEPTNTCLAIGPDYADRIDPITGELQLL